METAKTIIELKEAFLRAQIRLLTARLEPTEKWRDYAKEPEQGDLSEKVVEEVLQKVNVVFKQHNRAVYSSQALRHVAEQIDALYWDSVRPDSRQGVVHNNGLGLGMDLTSSGNIAQLPEQWHEEDAGQEQVSNYQQLQARLVALDAQRTQQQQRLAQYKHLQDLLQPFQDPQTNIQPNLVTKDGELGKELDRMRILVARVTGRIGDLKQQGEADGPDQMQMASSDEKLAAVLNMT